MNEYLSPDALVLRRFVLTLRRSHVLASARLMVWFCLTVSGLMSHMAVSNAWATPDAVHIGSITEVNSSPNSAKIEFVVSNDGSIGKLSLSATARSSDGAIRSRGWAYFPVPTGSNTKIQIHVPAPAGIENRKTDILLLTVYKEGSTQKVLQQTVKWEHLWPETPMPAEKYYNGKKISPDSSDIWMNFVALIEEEDFSSLDSLLNKWNTPDERDGDGSWKLSSFAEAIRYLTARDAQKHLGQIRKWNALDRKSPGAAIAEAFYWHAYAMSLFAQNTFIDDPVATRLFRERLKRAETTLANSKAFAAQSPLWHEAYLDVAISAKRERQSVDRLFDEGIRRFPNYMPLYLSMAKQSLPSMGQHIDGTALLELARKSVALTSQTEGQMSYALILSRLSYQEGPALDFLMTGNDLWPALKKSFDELMGRYPSVTNLNLYAAAACRANDRTAYSTLRPFVVANNLPRIWPMNVSMDLCDRRFLTAS